MTMQLLPAFNHLDEQRFAYGARSEAAAFVGALLTEAAPALRTGDAEIVAIARRPGVLSKVAVRQRTGDAIVLGGDVIAGVREQLDGERVEVVPHAGDPPTYIANALGVPRRTPMQLLPGIRHAHVFLGEIDLRGIAGWRNLNVVLASSLTGWRIRLLPVSQTTMWRRLEAARRDGTTVRAAVVEPNVVEIFGFLFARLPTLTAQRELEVRVRRLDPDEGRITVTNRLRSSGQLRLPESAAILGRTSSTSRD